MKFTVINTNANDGPTFRIHRAGCRDISLEVTRHHGHSWEVEAASAAEVIDSEMESLEDDDNPYPREAFSAAPCCGKARTK